MENIKVAVESTEADKSKIDLSSEELQVIHDTVLKAWKETMNLETSDKEKLTPREIAQHTVRGELISKLSQFLKQNPTV